MGFLLSFTFMTGVLWLFHRYRKVDKLNRGFGGASWFRRAQPGTRRERCAEDDGRHPDRVSCQRDPVERLGRARVGGVVGAPWRSGWARCSVGGGSCTRWGRRSRNPAGRRGWRPESAAAISLGLATLGGVPVSTTHTISGAIVGVGTTNRLSAVRWGVAGRVMWAWVLTIPGAFIMAYVVYLPFKAIL
jgi:hypothetical protein